MGLWGAHEDAEAKPKFLTDVEKRDCYATTQGWVVPAGGTDDATADEEVLVAIRGLSGGFSPGQTKAGLGAVNLTSINWTSTAIGADAGGALTVSVNFNEVVTVAGTPQVTLTSTGSHKPAILDYSSGSGTNRLTFTKIFGGGYFAATDVLSFGANATALNSGAIVDADDETAVITNSAAVGTAGGTITVGA